MKVRAKTKGQYKGVMKYPGDIFEIDEKPHPIHATTPHGQLQKDEYGGPVSVGERPFLEPWMEEVNKVTLKVSGNMLPKEGEVEQPKEDENV